MSWFHGAIVEDSTLDGSGPGFTRYTRHEFEKLRRQHNILVLVGMGSTSKCYETTDALSTRATRPSTTI